VLRPDLTRLEIENPTAAAARDFAVVEEGQRVIPNEGLDQRNPLGQQSGQSLREANVLAIRVRYCRRLVMPLIDRVVPALLRLRLLDPLDQLLPGAAPHPDRGARSRPHAVVGASVAELDRAVDRASLRGGRRAPPYGRNGLAADARRTQRETAHVSCLPAAARCGYNARGPDGRNRSSTAAASRKGEAHMIRYLKTGVTSEQRAADDAAGALTVEQIIADIESDGDAAVREYSERFDKWSPRASG
jgi:hypothetical protein